MTRNNASKKSIRQRMEWSGESYTVAKHKLETISKITVWELGEDGEMWFVENTTDATLAFIAVEQWLMDCGAPEMVEFKSEWRGVARSSWYWHPIFVKGEPTGESYLCHTEHAKHEYTNERLLTGVLVKG